MRAIKTFSFGAAVVITVLQLSCSSFCDEVYLDNGDKITGNIVKDENNTLTIKSDILGGDPDRYSGLFRQAG